MSCSITLRYSNKSHHIDDLNIETRVSELITIASKTFDLVSGTFVLRFRETDLKPDDQIAETELTSEEPFIDVIVTRQGFQLFRELQRLGKLEAVEFTDPQLGDELVRIALNNDDGNKKFVSLVLKLLDLVDPSRFKDILYRFARYSRDELFKLVLKYIDINAKVYEKQRNVLIKLVMNCDDSKTVRRLIDFGIDTHHRDDMNYTAFVFASASGHIESMLELLKEGIDINQRGHLGGTSLMFAALMGKTDVVRKLIELGADVNLLAEGGGCALTCAAQNNHSESFEELIKAGAKVNPSNGNGNSPLISASVNGNISIIKRLLELNADVSHTDKDGDTVLIFAVNYNQLESIRLLLKAGANPNIKNKKGEIAINYVKEGKERYEMVRELILYGTNDVDFKYLNGDSPLSLAVKNDDVFLTKRILEISENNKSRTRSLSIAVQRRNLAIIRVLMRS